MAALQTDKQNLQTDKQNLQTEKQNLQNESNRKTETINTQDKQLNTAWFAFGTKKELKRQNVLVKGKVLQGSFNKNYFTKIDIRETRELKLYSKNAKILTSHPTSSYSLTKRRLWSVCPPHQRSGYVLEHQQVSGCPGEVVVLGLLPAALGKGFVSDERWS